MNDKLANALLILRITVAIVFIMWTGNKFVNPVNAQDVYSGFFFMPILGKAVFLGIGIVEAIIVGLFLIGRFKPVTYLILLLIHTASTIAPYDYYLNAYDGGFNLLFFAAFPMWGACLALYMLRDYDTKFNF